eukprot:TRINITY_DN902_c3_g2_i3.p1 TRINITY_DN902_c3_g2~~TRINITY_DN902_c3_g2_i3.p1  ORF type:complete len:307 (+),score=-3.15 TRINITY_DN902_c3_g2_i3:132-1052(+)
MESRPTKKARKNLETSFNRTQKVRKMQQTNMKKSTNINTKSMNLKKYIYIILYTRQKSSSQQQYIYIIPQQQYLQKQQYQKHIFLQQACCAQNTHVTKKNYLEPTIQYIYFYNKKWGFLPAKNQKNKVQKKSKYDVYVCMFVILQIIGTYIHVTPYFVQHIFAQKKMKKRTKKFIFIISNLTYLVNKRYKSPPRKTIDFQKQQFFDIIKINNNILLLFFNHKNSNLKLITSNIIYFIKSLIIIIKLQLQYIKYQQFLEQRLESPSIQQPVYDQQCDKYSSQQIYFFGDFFDQKLLDVQSISIISIK